MANKERYSRNAETFSWEEMARIQQKSICVIGCGGLGGCVIQSFARFGVRKITVVDGDVFVESNLNRQIFSDQKVLGQKKAIVIQEALKLINEEVEVVAYTEMLTAENAAMILSNHDLVVDCLDNIETRHVVAKQCTKLAIPMVHGAIGGFYGQVANIFPGDRMMDKIYAKQNHQVEGIEKKLGNPPFIPQAIAAIQCSEGLKILSGKGRILRNELLYIDLWDNSFETITFM